MKKPNIHKSIVLLLSVSVCLTAASIMRAEARQPNHCEVGVADSCLMRAEAKRIEYEGAVHLFITVPGQQTAFERAIADALTFIYDRTTD